MDEKVKESVFALLDAAGGRGESTWGVYPIPRICTMPIISARH